MEATDPARAWASLYRLCRTYEHKLKEVSLKEVSVTCDLSIIHLIKSLSTLYNMSSGFDMFKGMWQSRDGAYFQMTIESIKLYQKYNSLTLFSK